LFKKATMLTPSTRESSGLVCANYQKTVCLGVNDMLYTPGVQLTPSLAVLLWDRCSVFWLSVSIGLLWIPGVRGDKHSECDVSLTLLTKGSRERNLDSSCGNIGNIC
jgi:hypothetical protein